MTESTAPPQRSRRRQAVLVGILAVVLAGVAWYRLRPAVPPVAASNGVATGTKEGEPLLLPEAVRMGALDAVPESVGIGRNPFVFGVRPAPPSSLRPAASPPGPPPPPPPPPGPPPINLRLTGMTQMPGTGRMMVTLKDPATGAIFQAFEGDVVDGRYRVVKVGLQSVVVSYLDGTSTRTIALGS